MRSIRTNLSAGLVLTGLAWAAFAQATAQEYTFTTLAGQPGTYGSADGTGGAARFNRPNGVAVDSAGNVYVGDWGNHTIRKVTPAGLVTTLAGLAGSSGWDDGTGSAARFSYPQGVAVDSAGNIYVADTGNDMIRKVTPARVVTTLQNWSGWPGDHYPRGVAADSAGNLYVGDTFRHTIYELTSAGVMTTLAGEGGSWGSADGTGAYARFYCPWGVALDSAGNIYVADWGNNTIRKVTPAGVVTTVAGLAGNWGSADGWGSAARFNRPKGVAVDSAGNVFITEDGNCTIRKVTPGGEVTTLAGSAATLGSDDGTGNAARFWNPSGVAVDGTGKVYVADTTNNTIRVGTTNTCPDAPRIDLAAGPVGQLRQLDTYPCTAFAWQWCLVRGPTGSFATLSAPNVRNPTFIPDVPGLYVFRLWAINTVAAICIRTLTFTATPPPPSITSQPLSQTAETGASAGFVVQVTNAPPGTTYQWYVNGTNALAGATNRYLTLDAVLPTDAGAYTLVVTNPYGCVTSAPATLSVIAPVQRRSVPGFTMTGQPGTSLDVDFTAALGSAAQWTRFDNALLSQAPQWYFDLSSPLPPQGFYRTSQHGAGAPPVLDMHMVPAITLTGPIGSSVQVDAINQFGPIDAWSNLTTLTLTNTSQVYFDTSAIGQPPRLYRLVPVP